MNQKHRTQCDHGDFPVVIDFERGTSITAPRPPSRKSLPHAFRSMLVVFSPVQRLGGIFPTPRVFSRLMSVRISVSLLPRR